MSPSNDQYSTKQIEELDFFDLPYGVFFRIDFADREGFVGPRYAVVYRDPDCPDHPLVVESSSGSPGIAMLLPVPLRKIITDDRICLVWHDGHPAGYWSIEGAVKLICRLGGTEKREIPNPLKRQLGMHVPEKIPPPTPFLFRER